MAIQQLENARRDLLDLSARNRLINTRRSSTRSTRLEIVDELADQVFQMLVTKGKSMSFLDNPKQETKDPPIEPTNDSKFAPIDYDSISFAQPDEELADGEVPERHQDDKLQTIHSSEVLQKKLLQLFYDARTFEEEQGVNTLYMAMGFLKWFEDDKSTIERQSPLILIPVHLERKSVGARFRVSWDEGEINTNLSLQAKLQHMFGINLPDIHDGEELTTSDYFGRVQESISIKKNWEVVPNAMVLWFFSFAKFLMYKDMDPEHWPEGKKISDHPIVSSLIGPGFSSEPPLCGEDEIIDDYLQPIKMVHVVPADSSQTIAIEEAKQGRNLVIQGPPGTGKSQTITNIIAAAVEDGKKVLFVSEKMAALQVVKQRLDEIHLGSICLELHSNKSNKRVVLQEIEKTLALGKPKTDGIEANAKQLTLHRDRLNQHAKELHEPIGVSQVTPYQAMGELVRLRSLNTGIASFSLTQPENWTQQQFRENVEALKDSLVHLKQVGRPNEHPWRGAMIDTIIPTDIERLQKKTAELKQATSTLTNCANTIASQFSLPDPNSFVDVANVGNLARHACKVPEGADVETLANSAWEKLPLIEAIVAAGKQLHTAQTQLEPILSDEGWEVDLATTRRHLKAYGKSWFRFFNSKFREAKATLSGILKGDLPRDFKEQLSLAAKIIAAQKAKAKIAELAQLGQQAFGNDWLGERSDWNQLEAILEWHRTAQQQKLPKTLYTSMPNIQRSELRTQLKKIGQHLNPTITELSKLLKKIKFDLKSGLNSTELKTTSLSSLLERMDAWHANPNELSKWSAFMGRLKLLPKRGMSSIAKLILKGQIDHHSALAQFEQVYFEALIRLAYERSPNLAKFSGASHETVLEKFRQLDSERYQLARQQVAAAHYAAFPHTAAEIGEVGILKREIKKKRRHMPIRKLLATAGHAIQAIKPVFMMSPISIAQFLEPGVLEFDILLIDEASQVKPVDALGAIARSKQIVVVGDERQLPPTSFFDNVVSNEDEDDDPTNVNTSSIESILGLCSAQSMNERMLRWHYRSRHHSLIAVSNHQFYDSRLYVVPNPSQASRTMGLEFRHIKDGVFDRGKSATNRVEARRVADAVLEHAANHPEKTLGVGAFSVAQRDAILDEVELRLLSHPELNSFFAAGRNEPFFVKNLENIQGDERDVIFISIGYGRDAAGKDSMNFGPIGKQGGERRLNVLITRAKERCIVFSSITSNYIDLKRTKAKGTAALKTYLQYAESGKIEIPIESDRGMDSEFERQVAKALNDLGFDVRAQIGEAGFFVDLAIVDPENPGRFLIGIECDGASYHSSRSARDRDKIRQAILEDRGWIIHRIWSTDWFQHPEDQIQAVLAAVEAAKTEWSNRAAQVEDGKANSIEQGQPSADEQWQLSRETASVDLPQMSAILSVPYQEADFPCPSVKEIHAISPEQLGNAVLEILAIEAPVHQSEVARRVAQIWGLNRAGSRIVEAVDNSIELLAENDLVIVSDSFVSLPNQMIMVRNRELVTSSNLKKPEHLPPSEIAFALKEVILANIGIESEEAIREVARLLGFRSTSTKLKATITPILEEICQDFAFEVKQGRIYK